MLPRGIRWQDMYPGYNTPGVDPSKQSTTIAASSPTLAAAQTAPAMVLVGVVALLVAIRIVYELAPTKGKAL